MYQLNPIGKLQSHKAEVEICLEERYKKALKGLEAFSHIHIFYAQYKNQQWQLNTQIAEIESLHMAEGKIRLKKWMQEEVEVDLLDIKPYFPCEDSVQMPCQCRDLVRQGISIKKVEHEEGYKIPQIGVIRQVHGEVFIQLEQWFEIKSGFIKVLWWFNRFDQAKYRKAVTCHPPYEKAPKMGILATRSPVRPNPLAMTVARVIRLDPYEKRVYLNQIESFDQTPCIGILEYDTKLDLIEEVKVPEWLSHWPQWIEDSKEESGLDKEVVCKNSQVVGLLAEHKKMEQKDYEPIEDEIRVQEELEGLWIQGAKENNLKGIDVKIPYHQITAVVGVSGSGKSSLVKDTIYAECKRRMEYLNNHQHVLQKPKVAFMSGCMPAVMISQKEIRGNIQSTIGTYTNAYDYLRMIYAMVGIRHCPRCGYEILPLSKAKIIKLLSGYHETKIYNLNKQMITDGSLTEKVEKALEEGKGALYATIEDGEYILMQTRQKCYRCDQLMFELVPATFSYIDPEHRCPVCHGTGRTIEIDATKIVEHPEKSLLEGASSFWGKLREFQAHPNGNWMKGQVFALAHQMEVDLEKPWNELPKAFKEQLFHGSAQEVTFTYHNTKNGRRGEIRRPVEGVLSLITRLSHENETSQFLQKYKVEVICERCKGERLNQEGRMVTIGSLRYPEAAAMSFEEILMWCHQMPMHLSQMDYDKVKDAIRQLKELAKAAKDLGIGYLELNRETNTLSGGEGQRLKLLSAMQNHMTGLLYLLDEPSKGLHPKDYKKVMKMMNTLKEEGNTIIMVEHNEEMIRMADHIIEIGPKAGEEGGYLVAEGDWEAMCHHRASQFSQYLNHQRVPSIEMKKHIEDLEFVKLKQLTYNNLKNIEIQFPKQALTCICGVSGSGKSSLMKGEIYGQLIHQDKFDAVCLVNQVSIGRQSRSIIATYIGIMDPLRSLMAETKEAIKLGYDEKQFSFNSGVGQCETCKGDGSVKLPYLEDGYIVCPDCQGQRYKKEVLQVTYQEKHIAQILQMSVGEAIDFFADENQIGHRLKIVDEMGLGYLKLGQSTITLSGGEATRLKLAKQLIPTRPLIDSKQSKKGILYLLDEPSTGLHFSDIDHMLHLIQKLINEGHTVVAIEHHKQFIHQANWCIELGPGAGREGGYIIKQGICMDE